MKKIAATWAQILRSMVLGLVILTWGAGAAQAYDSPGIRETAAFGTCTAEAVVSTPDGNAFIRLESGVTPGSYVYPFGSAYLGGVRANSLPPIRSNWVSENCGLTVVSIPSQGRGDRVPFEEAGGFLDNFFVEIIAIVPSTGRVLNLDLEVSGVTNSTATADVRDTGTAPTATIGPLQGPVDGKYTAQITIVSDGPFSRLQRDGLTLTNATATLVGSERSYTATLTPLSEGPVSMVIEPGAVVAQTLTSRDLFFIRNVLPSNTVSATFALTPPAFTLRLAEAPSLTSPNYVVLAEFNEQVAFEGPLRPSAGSVSPSTSDFTTWRFEGTLPPGPGATLEFPAGAFTNGAGAPSEPASLFIPRSEPPTATIGEFTRNADGTFSAAVTLSQAPAPGELSLVDFTVSNVSRRSFGIQGRTGTLTITPIAEGPFSATLPANTFRNAVGVLNAQASNIATGIFDLTAPTPKLRTPSSSVATGGRFDVTVTFDEAVTGLTADDFDVGNGTLTLETIAAGTEFRATVSPTGSDDVTVALPAGAAQDSSGNASAASSTLRVPVRPVPTATIGALTGPVDGRYTAVITLNTPSVTFTVEDLALTNATATLSGSGSSYTATLTPISDGAISVFVPAGRFSNANGDPNADPSNTVSTTFDGTRPTLTIASEDVQNDGLTPFTVTFTFSEPVTGFEETDILVENATIESFSGSGATYEAVLLPAGRNDVVIRVAEDIAEDTAGNGTLAPPPFVLDIRLAPTVTVGALSGPSGGVFTSAITLSVPSTDFTVEDLSLTNAAATLAGRGTRYIATLTPLADGEISLSVAAGAFSSTEGVFNAAGSGTVTASFDGTAPTVEITSQTSDITGRTTFPIAIRFSEAVTGFEVSDVTVTNGTAGNLTGAGADYTATISATGGGDVAISLAASVATDAAGNGNAASDVLVIGNQIVARTRAAISKMMEARSRQLLANQPTLSGLLTGGGSGAFSLKASGEDGALAFSSPMGADRSAWMTLSTNWSDLDGADGRYTFAAVGAHTRLSKDILVGMMVELDQFRQTEDETEVEGDGWLAGPYVVMKPLDQPIFLEGMFLQGASSNTISPLGTYRDDFDTERQLARLRLSGEAVYGSTTLFPSLSYSNVQDRQKPYTDSLGNRIGAQRLEIEQLSVGLNFAHDIALTDPAKRLEVTGGLELLRSAIRGSRADQPFPSDDRTEGGRINLGTDYQFSEHGQFNMSTYYDWSGSADYEGYGLKLGVSLDF